MRRTDPHDPLPGAIGVVVNPGDALPFDRRLWHMRSDNHSEITPVAAFFSYTYRWTWAGTRRAGSTGSRGGTT